MKNKPGWHKVALKGNCVCKLWKTRIEYECNSVMKNKHWILKVYDTSEGPKCNHISYS